MVTIRPITFTPASRPTQTRYLPSGATIRPIVSPTPSPSPDYDRPAGLTRPDGSSGGTLSPETIEARSQQVVNTRSAPYSHYVVQGGSWYGVRTVDGMEVRERLNPANANTYPNPDYRYQTVGKGTPTFTEGSAGNVQIAGSARPEAPGPGSSKAAITAYGEAAASWEREQLWRGIDPSMSYQDIASSWDNIRFDVPTQERRQYEISQSLLPQGTTSKQASIEAQYAAQRGTIVSSSGTLRPSAEGYRYSSGELFAVTPTGPAASPGGISGPSLPSPAQLPSAGVGMIGLIAREKLGMDYISGGNAMTSALQANKAPGVSGPIIPTETKLAIRNVALTLPGIRTVWSAGEYIGLDYLLGVKTSEYNKQYSALESQGLISGTEFRGSEAQYNSLNANYQQIESLQKMQGVALDRTLGVNLTGAQAGERWKVPGTRFEPATAAYDFGHGLTTQLSDRWKGIQGGIGKTFEPVAPVAVTMVAGGMMMAGMSPRVIPHTLSFVKGFGHGVAATPEFIGMAVIGAEGLIKHPQAVPGAAILGGYIQAKGIYEGVTTRPVEFAGEMYGTALGMGYAGRAIGKATGFGFGLIDIPTGRVQRLTSYESGRMVTTERPITTSMAGLYWRNPLERPLLGRTETLSARPLVGVAWGESLGRPVPFVGRYVLPENVPVGTGYLPSTPADWAFARTTMETRLGGADPFMRHIWDETFATRRVGHSMRGGTAPELAEPWGRVAPQTIPEPAWGEVAQYIRANRQDMVVYGSTTGRAFMGEYGRVTLGDLDIDIRPGRAQEHSQNIYNIVRRHQPNIGELTHETSMITGEAGRYTARMPSGEIVLDLHPYWEAKWDTPRSGLAESGGVRMMPLSRTVWGKTMFFLQYREVAPGRAIIEPYSGRFKDPADISLIMGKYSRDVLGKPLRWDINRIRSGSRLQLAQDSARISQSFEMYTRRYAEQGTPLIEEAIPALHGLDLRRARIPDLDIRIGGIVEVKGEWYLHPEEIGMFREVDIAAASRRGINEDIFISDKFGKRVQISRNRMEGSVDFGFKNGVVLDAGHVHTHPTTMLPMEPIFHIKSSGIRRFLSEAPGFSRLFTDLSKHGGGDLLRFERPMKVLAADLPLHFGDFVASMGRGGKVHGVISENFLQVGTVRRMALSEFQNIVKTSESNFKLRFEARYKELLKSEGVKGFAPRKRAELHKQAYEEAMWETTAETYRLAGGSFEKIPIQEVINRSIQKRVQFQDQQPYSMAKGNQYSSSQYQYKSNIQLPRDFLDYPKYNYSISPAEVVSASVFTSAGTSAVKYPTTASRYIDTYPKTASPGGKYPSPSPRGKYPSGYPSPAYLNKYLGYPPAKYPSVSKYGGIQRYPSGTRYPPVQRYPGGTKYPGVPKIPVYPGYPVIGKPPGYPTTNYPGGPTPPTTTTYPGITPTTTQYPGLTTKTASQLYPATTTTTRRQPPAPPEFPPPWRPPFTPPPTITIPRRWLTLTEEKPKKKRGIRLAPDVLASAWNLESPIPRIRQAFGYNIGIPLAKSQRRNELAISNIQKSRIPTRYVWKMPFEQIRRINVPKVI